jgi:hypothetical protein
MNRIKIRTRIEWAKDTWRCSKGVPLKLRVREFLWSVVVHELRAAGYNNEKRSTELLNSRLKPAGWAIRVHRYPELERND